MNKPTSDGTDSSENNPQSRWRITVPVILVGLTLVYTLGIVLGYLPADRRIDTANLILIALVIIILVVWRNPKLLDNLKSFELSGLKFVLEDVQERQKYQESQLHNFSMVLKLLLPEAEQKHLLTIADGHTTGFKANDEIRSQLRRLRSMGLIQMRPGQNIAQMKDSTPVDLSDFVSLTAFGSQWAVGLKQLQTAEAKDHEQ